jgi:hypothetical protein
MLTTRPKAINRASSRDSPYAHLADAVCGILFFGTPHRGADIAKWGERVANVFQLVTFGVAGNDEIVHALRRNSSELNEISKQFQGYLTRIAIRSFYETEKIGGMLVVSRTTLPFPSLAYLSTDCRRILSLPLRARRDDRSNSRRRSQADVQIRTG